MQVVFYNKLSWFVSELQKKGSKDSNLFPNGFSIILFLQALIKNASRVSRKQ